MNEKASPFRHVPRVGTAIPIIPPILPLVTRLVTIPLTRLGDSAYAKVVVDLVVVVLKPQISLILLVVVRVIAFMARLAVATLGVVQAVTNLVRDRLPLLSPLSIPAITLL